MTLWDPKVNCRMMRQVIYYILHLYWIPKRGFLIVLGRDSVDLVAKRDPKAEATEMVFREEQMAFTRLKLALAFSTALGAAVQTASAEELSVATFVPPSHESITKALAWFENEISERSNGELTLKLYAAGQLGAGPAQQDKRVEPVNQPAPRVSWGAHSKRFDIGSL